MANLKTDHTNQSTGVINMLKRDRFELLSAYLDGEVTATERRQVEDWLVNDPEIKRLYARLLSLRQSLRTMPAPPAQQPVEETIQQVFGRIEKRRHRKTLAWGGAAIAALFIGAISSILPSNQLFSPQLAQNSEPAATNEPLMVALNAPVVQIPKAAIVNPENSVNQADDPQHQPKNHLN